MKDTTIHTLVQLNKGFYQTQGDSFSGSRNNSWPGWERIALACREFSGELALLDVACGNLRFERFLNRSLPTMQFDFTCLDACPALAGGGQGTRFYECDVIEALKSGSALPGVKPHAFDVAVSFGFMHHVPTFELRLLLLRQLVKAVRSGGLVAVSFWQFMNDPSLARKAQESSAAASRLVDAALEEGDYLLGWNGQPGVYRYCHHFDTNEIDALVDALASEAGPAIRYHADGRNGALNEYVLLAPV